jgi:predicted transcriptional regulator
MPDAAAHREWFQQHVRAGLDAANAGVVLSADEVESQAVEWRERLTRLKKIRMTE